MSTKTRGPIRFGDGENSSVQGNGCTASGSCSHAEGWVTKASGSRSHAEGGSTTASGNHSHAEGRFTTAQNQSEHAEGQFNVSNSASTTYGSSGNTQHSVGIGTDNNTRKNAFEIMQNGDAYLYGVGGYDGTSVSGSVETLQNIISGLDENSVFESGSGTNSAQQKGTSATFQDKNENSSTYGQNITGGATGNLSTEMNGSSAAIGDKSIAEGHRCIARGESSHAEGHCSVIENVNETNNGYGSHAEGYSTLIDGVYSHSEGSKTIIHGNNSHAEGSSTIINSDFSHAEGYGSYVGDSTDAPTIPSSGEGSGGGDDPLVNIKGSAAHAEGNYTVAEGSYSHAEGWHSKSIGEASHAEGAATTATGIYSHSEGKNAQSTGAYSHAEGEGSSSVGPFSHAEGSGTTSTGAYSHSEGDATTSVGAHSHSEGWVTQSIGEHSHAEGQNTRAHGVASHSEGNNTDAYGSGNHAEGLGTRTNTNVQGQHAEGRWNSTSDGILAVGVGTNDSNRKNAFEIMQNGGAYLYGVGGYDGTNATASTSNTIQQSINERFHFVEGTSSRAGNASSGHYLATKWEASIPGITAATNGLKLAYRIRTNTGVATGGVVLSVDGTNYYPVVIQTNSIVTTHYPVGSTILTVFNAAQTATTYLTENVKTTVTGCWQIMEYDSNSNTIGYQLRTHYSTRPVTDQTGRYRLLFSSPDNTKWIPANTATTTNATAARGVNQRPINPFGEIVYYGYTTVLSANTLPVASYLWQQYPLSLGYSFNTGGTALSLTYPGSIYVKCKPQSDGSAIIDATTPIVQTLPSTEDGNIYIYLGRAYSAETIEMVIEHPVYYYKDGEIRLWTNAGESQMAETTWSDLKSLRDSSGLTPGKQYRITDYNTTTTQENTQSAGHQFDIIVVADDNHTLNENARAASHAGDTYFSGSTLEAWELKYDLDNDTARFDWADTGATGRGVIYWMKDEYNNECPYDFKNIQFKVGANTQPGTVDDVFYYTFSVATGTNDATVTDHSLDGAYCYGNKMGVYTIFSKRTLPFNVFRNTSATSNCYSNTFGNACSLNTFGNACYSNTFGNRCDVNKFGNGCNENTFGNGCAYNTFGIYCTYNTFGNDCAYNTFGSHCTYNILENSCVQNVFKYCTSIVMGNKCRDIVFGETSQYQIYGMTLENNCKNLQIIAEFTGNKNVRVVQGTRGSNDPLLIEIPSDIYDKEYETKVAQNSKGELVMYCEADLIYVDSYYYDEDMIG